MIKKLIGIALIGIMMFGALGLAGCENSGEEIQVDGWTLYRFDRYSDKEGQVTIMGADESLVEDGVLFVPAKIGDYDIHGFGRWGKMLEGALNFNIPSNAERIVISAELYVDEFFWQRIIYGNTSVKYVEFLCETFERVACLRETCYNEFTMIIIPDGTTANFIAKLEKMYPSEGPDFEYFSFIEKSDFEAEDEQ